MEIKNFLCEEEISEVVSDAALRNLVNSIEEKYKQIKAHSKGLEKSPGIVGAKSGAEKSYESFKLNKQSAESDDPKKRREAKRNLSSINREFDKRLKEMKDAIKKFHAGEAKEKVKTSQAKEKARIASTKNIPPLAKKKVEEEEDWVSKVKLYLGR